MTVYAITDTKKGRTWIVPTYLQTTPYPQFFYHYSFHTKQDGNTPLIEYK